jgi:hypothetical protein
LTYEVTVAVTGVLSSLGSGFLRGDTEAHHRHCVVTTDPMIKSIHLLLLLFNFVSMLFTASQIDQSKNLVN